MASRRESPDERSSAERSENPFGPGEKVNYKTSSSSKQKAAKSRGASRKQSRPDADADTQPAADAESVERRRIVPIPAEGPIVYVSYAYADSPRVEAFVNALRENGIRAQCDALGFIDERRDRAATRYRDAINRSEHVFLFTTKNYIERASPGAETGVRMDIEMISDWMLLDPRRHAQVVSLRAGAGLRGSPILPLLHEVDADDPASPRTMDMVRAQIRHEGPWTPSTIRDFAVRSSGDVGRLLFRAGGAASAINSVEPVVSLDLFVKEFVRYGARGRQQNNASSWAYSFVNDRARSGLGGPGNEESWDTVTDSPRLRAESTLLDSHTSALLAWAALLSRKSTTSDSIGLTHLLAAILHRRAPWTEAAGTCLWGLGLDPDELCERLAREIASWPTDIPDDFLKLWIRDENLPPLLLGDQITSPSASRGVSLGTTWSTADGIADVVADDPSEAADLERKVDHLQIDPDVIAFARVAASWDLVPPLAIGLFGDWGSGKTFFMKRMKSRIEGFSKEARNDKRPQRDLEYCKYVVQIEFNAWHYSEGDLWACLVDHIFTNLRLSDSEADSEVARRVKTMLTEMDSLSTKGQAAEAHAASLKRATDEAEKELAAAQSRLLTAQSEFTAASVRDVWDIIRADEDLQEQIKNLLRDAGVKEVHLSQASDIREVIENARSLSGRVNQVVHYLRSRPVSPQASIIIGVALLAPVLLFSLSFILGDGIGGIVSAIGAAFAALAGGVPIYRTIAGHVSEFVDILDKPLRMAEEARRIELNAIQARIQHLTEQRLEAEQHKKDIESQKQDLQKRIDAVNASRILTEFLQDRAGTDDYRKRLGTLALIRRDFERLSNLMSEQRKEAIEGKTHSSDPDDKYRVNRIILYIDDLDRCAPAKVVEVLQAIHLLLAFPLFVVVVGVDARWVQRSIKQRYNELLRSKDEASHKEAQEELGIASPRDYLEKIFQIPFWLPPLGIGGCHALMDGILRTDVAAASDSKPQPVTQQQSFTPGSDAANTAKDTQPADLSQSQPNSPTSSTPGASSSADPLSITGDPASNADASNQPQGTPAEAAPQVANSPVAITGDEATLMKRFAPIVGTSPRSVKRFINCYRLFKSVVPGGRPTPEPTATETNLSMFFLAVVVGAPDLFAIIHETIARFDDTAPTIAAVRDAIVERMNAAREASRKPPQSTTADKAASSTPADGISPAALAQWRRVEPILDALTEQESGTPLRNTAWIIERARRFGYDTAMSPTPPSPAPNPTESADSPKHVVSAMA